MVAFGQLIQGHGQAIRERAKTVAYRAARQTVAVKSKVNGGALARNASSKPTRKAVQRPEGATPRAHTLLSQKASPAVRPAALRDQTRAWYNAREQFFRLERGIFPARPPNPALQSTASRTRSLLFEGRCWVRSRPTECQTVRHPWRRDYHSF
jgi:hypothetical protein